MSDSAENLVNPLSWIEDYNPANDANARMRQSLMAVSTEHS